MKKQACIAAIILALAMVWGCDDGDDAEEAVAASNADILSLAWKNYGDGFHFLAKTKFEELIDKGAYPAEAHAGLAWCQASLFQLDDALDEFQEALDNNPSAALAGDIRAGLSFIYDAQNRPDDCLAAIALVDPAWDFEHRTDLDYNDLILLKAMNHYAQGDLDDSLSEVKRLDPTFDADTTTTEGRAALAGKIEALRAEV